MTEFQEICTDFSIGHEVMQLQLTFDQIYIRGFLYQNMDCLCYLETARDNTQIISLNNIFAEIGNTIMLD